MQKKILFLAIVTVFSFIDSASAQINPFTAPQGQVIPIVDYLLFALNMIWYIAVTIVVIFFVMAGFKFLNSKGDPYELQTARRFLIWAVAGAIVIILAFSIISILRNTLLI